MKELFCDRYVLQGFDEVGSEIILREDATGQSIKIGGVPNDAILIKLDVDKKEYKKRSSYFRTGLGFVHQGCDYCLILEHQKQAILFELKSSCPKGYVEQFVASELFIDYCVKVWNKYKCTNLKLSFKRVLLSTKFNRHLTSSTKLLTLKKTDKCKNEVTIISPGFPQRIHLNKLLQ